MAERVLIIGPVPPAFGGRTSGGVASHVADLAGAMANRGWEVGVFGSNLHARAEVADAPWGPLFAPFPPKLTMMRPRFLSTAVNTLAARGLLRTLGQQLRPALAQSLGTARAVAHFQPDLIHFHHAELRPLYARLAGAWRLPWVITMHSLSSFRDEADELKTLARRHLRQARAVICVSDDTAHLLTGYVPGVVPVVVPNGIDVALFSAPGPRAEAAPDGPLVMYVGWIAASKGVEDLAVAFADVLKHAPEARLALVGPEIDLEADSVIADAGLDPGACAFSGPVPAEEVAAWLRAASVLVLPSRIREGQSRVVIEAMAAGVPVVATMTGGPEEVLERGRLGTLVPPEDPTALADAIVASLDHPDVARTARAREAAARYDAARVAVEIEQVYRSALSDEGATR
jgi:glycosyltransferase involved in cell wall biosynthesis